MLDRYVWTRDQVTVTRKGRVLKAFDPNQARDERGRWTSGGGTGPAGFVDHSPDVKSAAWNAVTKEIRAQGVGNCYEASMTLMLDAQRLGLENPRLIQATVMGQGSLEGTRFGHSWVEADAQSIDHPEAGHVTFRNAFDWSSGNSVVMPDALYRHLGQAQDVHEYTMDEAGRMALDRGTYGPWELPPGTK